MLARTNNRLVARPDSATGDDDIVRLNNLLIDVDSVREDSHVSANEAELAAALDLRDATRLFLAEAYGCPPPVLSGVSGNGGMLVYRIDLDNTSENAALLQAFLTGLATGLDRPDAIIDRRTFNPSRIGKIAGTVAAKGADMPDRPHRRATAEINPTIPVPIPIDVLRAVAALAPATAPRKPTTVPSSSSPSRRWSVPEMLDRSGFGYRERQGDFGTVYQLDRCPTSDDHLDGAAIIEMTSGAIVYCCLHNRCRDKTWADVRALFDIPINGQGRADSSSVPTSPPSPPASHPPLGQIGDGPVLVLQPMSEVTAKPIDWIWNRWLAKGKLHLLAGVGGIGKGTIMAEIASQLSTGKGTLPDGARAPLVKSLFLLSEDAPDDTLKPRLETHGADTRHVFHVVAVREPDGANSMLSLAKHVSPLEEAILTHGIGLVVIDALSDFLAGVDRYSEGAVRDVLTPLADMARRTGVAVMGVMHPGKGNAELKAFQRILGASAFGNVARCVWLATESPDDDGRNLLGVDKSNLAIKPKTLAWSRAEDQPIVWHGESDHDIGDAFGGTTATPRDDAEGFLNELLRGGSVESSKVKALAEAANIKWRTVERAKTALKVEVVKVGFGADGRWRWKLPDGPGAKTATPLSPAVAVLADGDGDLRRPPSGECDGGLRENTDQTAKNDRTRDGGGLSHSEHLSKTATPPTEPASDERVAVLANPASSQGILGSNYPKTAIRVDRAVAVLADNPDDVGTLPLPAVLAMTDDELAKWETECASGEDELSEQDLAIVRRVKALRAERGASPDDDGPFAEDSEESNGERVGCDRGEVAGSATQTPLLSSEDRDGYSGRNASRAVEPYGDADEVRI
jgi:putative DNA primase/helicase